MGRILCLLVIFAFCLFRGSWAMSREQLKKTGKLMKNTCMPKNQVTEEMVGTIEEGNFIEDRNVMCYIACIYNMIGVVKNGKMEVDMAIKQIDIMYPPEIRETSKKAVAVCGEAVKKYKDLCESAYRAAKCMYEADPKSFIFP